VDVNKFYTPSPRSSGKGKGNSRGKSPTNYRRSSSGTRKAQVRSTNAFAEEEPINYIIDDEDEQSPYSDTDVDDLRQYLSQPSEGPSEEGHMEWD
jgi:hypothetical protein